MTALREVVADLLEYEGAVVEAIEPDGLDVLAPATLRTAFGWPELVRLGFGNDALAGTIRIGLDDDWLERLDTVLGERGRIAERQLVLPEGVLPPNDPERLIDGALSLPNAVWRLKGVEAAWTRCLLLAFRYAAVSDEKREGLVWVGFNCTTGAVLDEDLLTALRRAIDRADSWQSLEPTVARAAGPAWGAATIADRTGPLLDRLVRADLEPFLAAMLRRLDRDRRRVHAYHDDLRRAALIKLAGLERLVAEPKPRKSAEKKKEKIEPGEKLEAAIARERLRVASIEREYAAKLDDLRHNYALNVTIEWVQALVLVAPVQRHEVLIKRRKGERSIAMDWHVAARRMEPAPSDWGIGLDTERHVCDDHLHLTDAGGQAACRSCGKPFCRACHPAACPRCRKSWAALAKPSRAAGTG